MAISFNQGAVAAQAFGVNASRQRLLTEARVKGTHVLLDRWTLAPDGVIDLGLAERDLA